MSNKKDKERWKIIQENKKKTCMNCSQLKWGSDGNPRCYYDDKGGEKTKYYGGCILTPEYIKQPHECYDRYNGKNLK